MRIVAVWRLNCSEVTVPNPQADLETVFIQKATLQYTTGEFKMSTSERFTNATGAPVRDNTNILTAGHRGPALVQDICLIEKLAHFDRELIPERRQHAKGRAPHGTFSTPHDVTKS